MFKKIISFNIVITLMMVVLSSNIVPAFAQNNSNEIGIITLEQLGESEIFLNGPYDSTTVTFGLPADWSLTGSAQLDLNLTAALSVASESNSPAFYGGLVTVKFNRQTVAILPLNSLGMIEQAITIPAELFVSPRTDGRMELRFELDSAVSCLSNQQMNVVINRSTRLTFPYEQVQPDTDLTSFPYPIYQDTIYPDAALIVIPDNPTPIELQAVMSTAAGFGNLTFSRVDLDLITVSELTEDQKANNHLVFIGQAASLPELKELNLPLPLANGNLNLTSSFDDGVVEMVGSPWNISKVALVITGNTEEGVLKASQAVSTGSLQVDTVPNLAIIKDVHDDRDPLPLVLDQTLEDLGNDVKVFNDRGLSSTEYIFYVPAGSFISSDAYFELAYAHSALLNMNLSGLVVTLNGQPIGSVQFTDVRATEVINTTRFSIPQTLVLPGANRIGIRVSLEPLDYCSDPSLESLFANIWPQSRLFIPFTSAQIDITSRLDLSNYPVPFSNDSTMSGIAFVLQQDDLNVWENALQVAKFLGDRSNGPISMPRVFLDGGFSTSDLADYNLIVMGIPSQMSVMDELNPALPIPFDIGTDQISDAYSQVVYRISTDTPQGYVELLSSPWNTDTMVLVALGNTTDGVTWAGSALSDSLLRSQLAGNFAVINHTQVKTTDTRLGQLSSNYIEPTIQPPVAEPSSPIDVPAILSARPSWILPVLIVVGVLILITLIFVLFSNSRKREK